MPVEPDCCMVLWHDMDWKTTGRVHALLGAYKIERAGIQNHITQEEFTARFKRTFDYSFQIDCEFQDQPYNDRTF